jgi:parvulin-like peptidyl-prolyl isomerase
MKQNSKMHAGKRRKQMSKSTYFKFSMLVLALAMLAAMPCFGQTQPAATNTPDPVAKVNGQPIGRALYEDRLSAYHGVYMLENLIAETLLNAEAAKRGVSVTEQEVTQRVKEMRARSKPSLENQESFRSWLMSREITENRYRDQARITLLAEKMFAAEAKVMEVEVAKFYDDNKGALFEIKATAKVWVLQTGTEDLAKKALEMLRAGKSFQEVIKAYPEGIGLVGESDSPMTLPIDQLLDPMRAAVEQAPLKSYSGPVKVLKDSEDPKSPAISYLVIRVDERTPGRVKTFAEVKDDIRRDFFTQRIFGAGGKWSEWMTKALADAKIERLITFTGEPPVREAEKPPAVNPK